MVWEFFGWLLWLCFNTCSILQLKHNQQFHECLVLLRSFLLSDAIWLCIKKSSGFLVKMKLDLSTVKSTSRLSFLLGCFRLIVCSHFVYIQDVQHTVVFN